MRGLGARSGPEDAECSKTSGYKGTETVTDAINKINLAQVRFYQCYNWIKNKQKKRGFPA